MAVQAHYPFNVCNSTMMMDELQVLCCNSNGNRDNNNDVVFSNQESELTCIGTSKKRMRAEPPAPIVSYRNFSNSGSSAVVDHRARLVESAGTSTSGRPPAGQDLVAQLHRQSLEVDALVRLQNERLRLGLEQAQKRHCRDLISTFQQQALKKLGEKEMELGLLARRNADLEEKLRQMSAENQIWFSVARNNEAIVSGLKASLEQVLLQNADRNGVAAGNGDGQEGYGDSGGADEDDARSNNNGAVVTEPVGDRRMTCRVCGENDAGVLVLPCRHLCLCKGCESKADTCPICHVSKHACLQVFLG